MKHATWILLLVSISLGLAWTEDEPGPLVLVGGGGTPEAVVREALRLAGGDEARVLIVPWASDDAERGESSVEMYRELGATDVRNADRLPAEEVATAFATAELLWMPGGDQSRLMEGLRDRGLVDVVRAAHRAGCVVGGTSAGCAVATDPMIARSPEERGVRNGIAVLEPGLGLWPGVLVDQHFAERGRQSRLLSAVLDDPARVGVGVGESTAVVVEGGRMRVLGESVVLVYDAREASVEPVLEPGAPAAARGVRLDVLRAGMQREL